MNHRVLVLGGHGYIGTRLVQRLSRQLTVVAPTSRECDLEDAASLERFIGHLPTGTYSVVLLAVINKSRENTFSTFTRNVAMVRHVASAVTTLRLRGMVYFSSVDVYGSRPPAPLTETSPLDPDSWYGVGKQVGEWVLRHEARLEAPLAILRIPGIYGPGANDPSVIGRFVRQIREARRITVRGTGRSLRDYVTIDDVCAITERLIAEPVDARLNVATGASVSIRAVVDVIREALDVDFDVAEGPREADREFDLVFDTAHLHAALPGFRFMPLAEGVRAYAAMVEATTP